MNIVDCERGEKDGDVVLHTGPPKPPCVKVPTFTVLVHRTSYIVHRARVLLRHFLTPPQGLLHSRPWDALLQCAAHSADAAADLLDEPHLPGCVEADEERGGGRHQERRRERGRGAAEGGGEEDCEEEECEEQEGLSARRPRRYLLLTASGDCNSTTNAGRDVKLLTVTLN